MQDPAHSGTRPLAVARRRDVAFDKRKTGPLVGGDAGLDIGQIVPVPVGEIIQTNHPLIERQKLLDQVRPDKTRCTGDKPLLRSPGEVEFKLVVGGGHFRQETDDKPQLRPVASGGGNEAV